MPGHGSERGACAGPGSGERSKVSFMVTMPVAGIRTKLPAKPKFLALAIGEKIMRRVSKPAAIRFDCSEASIAPWPPTVMKVACEGSIPIGEMRRIVTSCNPPREEIPINFPSSPQSNRSRECRRESSSTRSTKHMTTRVLMPRMFATTPEVSSSRIGCRRPEAP